MEEFLKFPKMPRLSRDIIITEKIDGTNAQIFLFTDAEASVMDLDWVERTATRVSDDLFMACGSRNRYILPTDDNYGFARWAWDNHKELAKLGAGRHYGEWWGQGIQRKYGMDHKVFSLFNVDRWTEETKPSCCSVVPTLYRGPFETEWIDNTIKSLDRSGSVAAPGFNRPEGIIIYHTQGRFGMKKTIEDDDSHKSIYKKEN